MFLDGTGKREEKEGETQDIMNQSKIELNGIRWMEQHITSGNVENESVGTR